jgi:hypothetical protein
MVWNEKKKEEEKGWWFPIPGATFFVAPGKCKFKIHLLLFLPLLQIVQGIVQGKRPDP